MKLEVGKLYRSQNGSVLECYSVTSIAALMNNIHSQEAYYVNLKGKQFGNDREGYDILYECNQQGERMTHHDVNNVNFEQLKKANPEIGRKYDAGKPMYSLIPADALEEVAKVLTYGAVKYNEPIDQENWRFVDNPDSRYFSAAQRHQWADRRGEDRDPESGIWHLAHAITSLMFKLQLKIEQGKNNA